MHELGVVEGIRDTVLTHARAAGVRRVLSVRLALADHSRYLEDALAMFWHELCGDSEAAGARIEFIRVPGEWLCLACCKRFTGAQKDGRCPECGGDWLKPIAAEECYVESIEVETSGG